MISTKVCLITSFKKWIYRISGYFCGGKFMWIFQKLEFHEWNFLRSNLRHFFISWSDGLRGNICWQGTCFIRKKRNNTIFLWVSLEIFVQCHLRMIQLPPCGRSLVFIYTSGNFYEKSKFVNFVKIKRLKNNPVYGILVTVLRCHNWEIMPMLGFNFCYSQLFAVSQLQQCQPYPEWVVLWSLGKYSSLVFLFGLLTARSVFKRMLNLT